ncbi:hypothetical protein BDW75DRAFT_229641 [Aspergillus navahoensis]
MPNVSRCFYFGRYYDSATNVIVFTFFILYLLSIRHYHGLSYRDPTSFFFDADRAYERRYSSKRVKEASIFIGNAGEVMPLTRDLGEQPILCVGIVSVRRRGDQFVGLTVGSLLESLSESERRKMLLYLRIADTNPADHPIYSEKWVEMLPDRLLTYSKDNPDSDQLQKWEKDGCGAEYIAMLEDDTLAAKGCFPSTMQALHIVQQHTVGRDWIYLRLFYIDGLLGWNSEEWPNYLAWSFIIWAAFTGAIVAFKRKFKNKLRSIPSSLIWLISCVFIPAAIGLHFMAGRQTMWPLSPGVHEMNRYGCCSQGLVFPRAMVPRFLEHTDLTTDWGWWAVVPPLLQHIGSTSSKGYGFDNSASMVWNFRFEEYPT